MGGRVVPWRGREVLQQHVDGPSLGQFDQQIVPAPELCLDIGTGALALLAIIAARAGAEHVFAIEANAEAAAAARQTVAAEGLEAQITVIEGYSTDVTLPRRVGDLPPNGVRPPVGLLALLVWSKCLQAWDNIDVMIFTQ